MKPVAISRISQTFGNMPSSARYASVADSHGPAGHHTGVDYGSAWPLSIDGRKVRAVADGTVVLSEFTSWSGEWVGVYSPALNVTYTYWHGRSGSRIVRVGQSVKRGTPLMLVGSTGNSTAPHLHVQANPGNGFNYHAHIPPARAFGHTWEFIRKRSRNSK